MRSEHEGPPDKEVGRPGGDQTTGTNQKNTSYGGDDISADALEYGRHNWAIFPGRGKVPAIAGGRGVLDATTDLAQIEAWWSGRYRGANILGRVPESMIVIDVDPRNGGDVTIAELQRIHGRLPVTLTNLSGRGDGGSHRFYWRPPGKLSGKRLGVGVDLKVSSGYVVLPPSIHPDTGRPYVSLEHPVAAPPRWLVELLLPPKTAHTITPARRRSRRYGHLSGSIADRFSQNTSWADVLGPHGWRCLDADPDADGARWLHPKATSSCSATIRHRCLFVYSPNTPFDVTEADDPRGYTRFRAYAVLEHGGDMLAAARALSGVR